MQWCLLKLLVIFLADWTRSILFAHQTKPYQPVAQTGIHACAAIETRICLVWGAGEMGTLPSCTATQDTTQNCHRHQWNTFSCGYCWHMTLFMLADASAAMSAVCSYAFINANLGDFYIQDAFQLWRTISCIHLTFPQKGNSQVTAKKSPSPIFKTCCCATSFQLLPHSIHSGIS